LLEGSVAGRFRGGKRSRQARKAGYFALPAIELPVAPMNSVEISAG
jgi:hypothetical protein